MDAEAPYKCFSNFILRTPLFPLNFVNYFMSSDKEIFPRLSELFQKEIINEAIFLSSPMLHEQLERLFTKKNLKPESSQRLIHTFLKYLNRMSVRPTPFGLFAGVSLGSMSDKTKIILEEQSSIVRKTRFDMEFLCEITNALENDKDIRKNLLYYPNTSIYKLDKQIRYIEYHTKNLRRSHHLVSVDKTDYLEKIIQISKEGATINNLVLELTDNGFEKHEAHGFVEQLVKNQILITELYPALTGKNALERLIGILKRNSLDGGMTEILDKVNCRIKALDNKEKQSNSSTYKEISDSISGINVEFDKKYLLQVDMERPCKSCTIDTDLANDVLKGMVVLKKLSATPHNARLSKFKNDFLKRYEGLEVPLLEALDEDIGVGYGLINSSVGLNPMIDNLIIPDNNDSYNISWDRIQSFYLSKYHEALEHGSYEVKITDKDLNSFECCWDDFPETVAVLARFIQNGNDHDIILDRIGGSGAANLITRFAHLNDEILELTKEIAEKERSYYQDAIVAEIIHLPQSRTGNILYRPSLRDFEIPFLGSSSLCLSNQIHVDDILLSLKNNKIILMSGRYQKQIIPRLTAAHNYNNDPVNVYQFLCDMQLQDKVSSISFDWGKLSSQFKFLPRVRYKNVILFVATWNIPYIDIKTLENIDSDEELLKRTTKWRKMENIPGKVLLGDNDNQLMIDFDSPISVRLFLSMVKNRQIFTVREFLFNEDNGIVSGQDGSYTSELLIPFYRKDINR